MDKETRAAVAALLNDVVQSEHRLRHQNAFEAMCKALGFTTEHGPSHSTVIDPEAVKTRVEADSSKTKDR